MEEILYLNCEGKEVGNVRVFREVLLFGLIFFLVILRCIVVVLLGVLFVVV